MKLGNSHRRLF